MSLVEVMLASLILLIIALGIIPLFARAMRSNQSGAESTFVANMAVARAEEFLQLDYDAAVLQIPEGDLSRVYNEVYLREKGEFVDGVPSDYTAPSETPLWTRVTTLRQYNVNDLTTPVPGEPATNPNPSAQLKEIEVTVTSLRQGGPLGTADPLVVRVLKSP